MDRRRKVELFEEIRREYTHGAGTIRAVAKKLGVHRRMVRQALASAIPPERKTGGAKQAEAGSGDGVHRRDSAQRIRQAPRKQRHTAHRIWERIRQERPEHRGGSDGAALCAGAQARAGLTGRETFVPQVYDWGGEAQVDWYEAMADFAGERLRGLHFCDALDGERRSVSRGLLSRHAAGLSGSARVGISLFRRRVPAACATTT